MTSVVRDDSARTAPSELAPALDGLAVARAAELARSGRYEEAEEVLAESAGADRPSAERLDLLARIRAQQGRLEEAEALWEEALALDAGAERYRDARRRVGRLRARPRWPAQAARLALAFALVAGLTIPALLLLGELDELGDRVERLEGAESSPQRASGEPASPAPAPVPAPAARRVPARVAAALALPGVRARTEANETVVTFRRGLFSADTALTREGRTVLVRLGRRLEPFVGRVAADVIGHTDNLPLAGSGNALLEEARAAAVAEFLRARTRLPAWMFTARHSGGGPGPYPNETAAGRRRNRTVAIAVSGLPR